MRYGYKRWKHRKGHTQINIDLAGLEQHQKLQELTILTTACLETAGKLGALQGFVEKFEISFVQLSGLTGPRITIIFSDPIGKTCSFTTDYRFMGTGNSKASNEPSTEDIVKLLCKELPPKILAHLKKCKEDITKAGFTLDILFASSGGS